jgi:hypothetical protein
VSSRFEQSRLRGFRRRGNLLTPPLDEFTPRKAPAIDLDESWMAHGARPAA